MCSFGHLIADNMRALVELPTVFNSEPEAWSWVLWTASSDHLRVTHHYRTWISDQNITTWTDLLSEHQGAVILLIVKGSIL